MWCGAHFVAMVTGRNATVTGYRGVVSWLAGLTVSIITGLRYHDPSGQAVTLTYHHKVVHRLRNGLRRKHPERWRRQDWLYQGWQCAGACCCGQCSNIWAPKQHCGPSPFSLASSGPRSFFLFLRTKRQLRRRRTQHVSPSRTVLQNGWSGRTHAEVAPTTNSKGERIFRYRLSQGNLSRARADV